MAEKGFIIQDIETERYVRHNGGESPVLDPTSYPFDYMKKREKATVYPDFKHACFVAFWYLEHFKKWRILDTETGKTYVKDYADRFKEEIAQPALMTLNT